MVPAGWWSSAKTPFNSTFVSEFIAKYGGTPAGIPSDAAEAYSVGEVVDQAAQKAHSIANAALIAALHTGTYQTIQGPDVVRFARQAERRKLPRPMAERSDRSRVSAVGRCCSAGVPQARLLRVTEGGRD